MQNANVSALRLNGFFVGEREGEEEKSHYVKLLTNLMGNVQSESNKSFGVELRWCDWMWCLEERWNLEQSNWRFASASCSHKPVIQSFLAYFLTKFKSFCRTFHPKKLVNPPRHIRVKSPKIAATRAPAGLRPTKGKLMSGPSDFGIHFDELFRKRIKFIRRKAVWLLVLSSLSLATQSPVPFISIYTDATLLRRHSNLGFSLFLPSKSLED